jgi:hypothetical protein
MVTRAPLTASPRSRIDPHAGRMRLTLTYCACALSSKHAPYYYLLRMRGWVCLMLTADMVTRAPLTARPRSRIAPLQGACALLSLIAHAR